MNDKLKLCPFCGVKLHKHYRYYHHEINGCIFDDYEFFEKDFEKWNTRKPVEKVLEQLEEEVKKCREYRDGKLVYEETAKINGIKEAIEIIKEEMC